MNSTKCVECGFVGWSDLENCKACGAPLTQRSTSLPLASPGYDSWDQPEQQQKKGLAIFSLVLGILSFLTFGLVGIGAILGIILAVVALVRCKREPWKYGGHGMAVAGLTLNIMALVSLVFVSIIAAIAIPNLLASRMAANEGSAIHSLRTISTAQATYYSSFEKYGTLEELAATKLIDAKLGSGVKNGYQFTVVLDDANPERFEVFGVPADYRKSGRRSFYVDETFVIRAADNHGGPSSKMDEPLESGSDYRREVRY